MADAGEAWEFCHLIASSLRPLRSAAAAVTMTAIPYNLAPGPSAMMKLLSSPASPYGRKVKITARVKGVFDRIKVEQADTSAPDNKPLKKENPLSKIPVLVLENGTQLYDSHVICEYLDSLKPSPRLFPTAGAERFNTLTLGALAMVSLMQLCCWSTSGASGPRTSGSRRGWSVNRTRSTRR
jgi:hypothetical protein